MGLLAGCGGSGGGDDPQVASAGKGGTSATSGTKKSNAEQAQAFVDCMRANGVTMEDPDPETGKLNLQQFAGSGADTTKLKKGLDACRDKMPQSIQVRSDQPLTPEQLDAQKQFAECMRHNGVDMDDPGPDGLDKQAILNGQKDQAAMTKCRDKLAGAFGVAK